MKTADGKRSGSLVIFSPSHFGGRERVCKKQKNKNKTVVLLVSCDGAHVKNAAFSEIINGEGVGEVGEHREREREIEERQSRGKKKKKKHHQ